MVADWWRGCLQGLFFWSRGLHFGVPVICLDQDDYGDKTLGVNGLTDFNAGLVSRGGQAGSNCLNNLLKTIGYKIYLVIELIYYRDGTEQE